MVYSTRRSVLCLTLCHLFLCFSVLLALRLPRLGKRELILVLFVRLFGLCLFGFVGFLFLLVSGKGCGLWLWHSLDFSLTSFFMQTTSTLITMRRLTWVFLGCLCRNVRFLSLRLKCRWNYHYHIDNLVFKNAVISDYVRANLACITPLLFFSLFLVHKRQGFIAYYKMYITDSQLTLVLLNPNIPCLCKQCRSRSGSALFAFKYVHLHQQSGSSNLTGRKLEMGVAS